MKLLSVIMLLITPILLILNFAALFRAQGPLSILWSAAFTALSIYNLKCALALFGSVWLPPKNEEAP